MAAWTGWESEFLTAAQVEITPNNHKFLDDWHSHAETNCGNNPVDLSAQVSTSTDCHALAAITAKAQHYPTHGDAAHAFFVQTHRASSTALLAALKSGAPYTVDNTVQVAEGISAWGSTKFAQVYFAETANAPGRSGGIVDTDALKGWSDLQRSVNRHMHEALHHSSQQTALALRLLGRARKVKH